MLTETFYDSDISHLEETVEKFSLDKIVFNVSYDRYAYGWTATVWYLPI